MKLEYRLNQEDALVHTHTVGADMPVHVVACWKHERAKQTVFCIALKLSSLVCRVSVFAFYIYY